MAEPSKPSAPAAKAPASEGQIATSAFARLQKIFEKWIGDKKVVIADAHGGSRAGLAKTLINMGAKTPNVILCPTYEEAEAAIQKHKPNMVVCEYELGKKCGLDLLQKQRAENVDAKQCLFVLVTGNSSQSAVAQAAEEDVDAFVLKPYTTEVLCNSIIKAACTKIQPSDYLKAIDEGKASLAEGKLAEAGAAFEKAQGLDSKPSLACAYLGQTKFMEKAHVIAEGSYNKGLEFNKIHYKCMVGLYDAFVDRKKHDQAYDIVKRLTRYFPANPNRLASVLRLAIVTRNYEDIERYYQTFTSIDARNEELIRYICAALVICGKYYLQTNFKTRALDLFQKAGITAAGRPKILREIITALCEFELFREAEQYIRRYPPDLQAGVDYLAMDLLISSETGDPGAVVGKGRQLLQAGHADPVIFRVLIKKSLEVGYKDAADQLLKQASEKHPGLANFFEGLYKQTLEKLAKEESSGKADGKGDGGPGSGTKGEPAKQPAA